jgi:hypothetical protein
VQVASLASQLPQIYVADTRIVIASEHCRSGLARESYLKINKNLQV